ncbi:MAG: type II secretion system protein GspL [Rhodoferax sp.]|uniref:type II secretion system protein GspL n=1 Tax=Rhodoferax sp. TaxID=50421 RepID=UPI00261F23C5|nr:type II secretion system protein GspL [Rhodoferax sp.]MDD5334638.1 type II secretion system protein GspL [Rhodoferax sp.]
MTTLIVTLSSEPADATALYDYLLTVDGNSVADQSRAPLALLPQVGNSGEVVVLVPAHKLSWHRVQLPKGSLGKRLFQDGGPPRLRSVLEGLLEEQLLDETAQLHFALEPQASDAAPVWVAVCDQAWLRAALQVLEQAGRPVSRIVPEFAPDTLGDALYVMGESEQAQLVFSSAGGVTLWPLSKASVALLNWPETRAIVAEPAVAALAEQLFKRSVTLLQIGQRRLQALQSAWDLAQFELANSSGARTRKRLSDSFTSLLRAPRWRAARFALLALLAVNLVGLNAWAWREQSQLKAQRAAINGLLISTFPQVRVVVDAPIQMGKEVAALERSSGAATPRDLEAMLGVFGLAAPPSAMPTAIEFAAGELRLKGLKLRSAEISAITFKLKPQAYLASTEADSLVIKQVSAP